MSITDFRKSPGKFLRQSSKTGLILYSHNRLIGYFLGAHSYDKLVSENRRQERLLKDLAEALTSNAPDLTKLIEEYPSLLQIIQDQVLYAKKQKIGSRNPSQTNPWLETLKNASF